MPGFYHFQHRKVSKRSLSSSSHVHRLLVEEPEVSVCVETYFNLLVYNKFRIYNELLVIIISLSQGRKFCIKVW